ncbi:hypothetical protein C1752_06142 [Acaryochloris thomasi RCC1774]|uniref:Uncharacterized protein n=1 Tax=Acaryochloris thomasi RCC1774 TaxID=1764569 RepID=A0A2W1JKQ3_9CYAN|nr:hypothetical protein [Acaryochloris thomasi]PZD71522.1 hypothetical protein C1752_06142 [Acaryochloris thomasi RCC1774]
MASEIEVKQYLAYWMQLGKHLVLQGGQKTVKPGAIIAGDRYSAEFEACWEQARDPNSGDCYLEGAEFTIAQLLTEQWDVIDCGRCTMPSPIPSAGVASSECPCHDLPSWPNNELPHPRLPISNQPRLKDIRQRLVDSKP